MSSARSSNQRWKYRKHTYLVRKVSQRAYRVSQPSP